jgi:hypothetical protein
MKSTSGRRLDEHPDQILRRVKHLAPGPSFGAIKNKYDSPRFSAEGHSGIFEPTTTTPRTDHVPVSDGRETGEA